MHTVLLGLVKDVFIDTMDVIWLIGRNVDPIRYANNISELDSRIIHFPRKHAIAPFILFPFSEGITKLQTASKEKSAKQREGSRSSGKIEAQKFPSLIFMMIISIGVNGDIVPNRAAWSALHNLKGKARSMNATDIILKSLCAIVDFISAAKCRDPTFPQISRLQEVMLI